MYHTLSLQSSVVKIGAAERRHLLIRGLVVGSRWYPWSRAGEAKAARMYQRAPDSEREAGAYRLGTVALKERMPDSVRYAL